MTWTDTLNEWGPMTVLMIVVAVVAVGVGGVVVVVHPETLTFEQYLDNLKTFALAIAGLAGARGILGAGKHVASARVEAAVLAGPDMPPDLEAIDVEDELPDAPDGTSDDERVLMASEAPFEGEDDEATP